MAKQVCRHKSIPSHQCISALWCDWLCLHTSIWEDGVQPYKQFHSRFGAWTKSQAGSVTYKQFRCNASVEPASAIDSSTRAFDWFFCHFILKLQQPADKHVSKCHHVLLTRQPNCIAGDRITNHMLKLFNRLWLLCSGLCLFQQTSQSAMLPNTILTSMHALSFYGHQHADNNHQSHDAFM